MEHLINTVLSGSYRVDARIATGGMGVVFAGTHLASGDRVAIKVLAMAPDAQPAVRERFLNEALAAARLKARTSRGFARSTRSATARRTS